MKQLPFFAFNPAPPRPFSVYAPSPEAILSQELYIPSPILAPEERKALELALSSKTNSVANAQRDDSPTILAPQPAAKENSLQDTCVTSDDFDALASAVVQSISHSGTTNHISAHATADQSLPNSLVPAEIAAGDENVTLTSGTQLASVNATCEFQVLRPPPTNQVTNTAPVSTAVSVKALFVHAGGITTASVGGHLSSLALNNENDAAAL